MSAHGRKRDGYGRNSNVVVCLGLLLGLAGLAGCDFFESGYSDYGYADYGYYDGYDSGWGSGAGAAGYGWSEYDSYGNQGASFSLAGDPGESVQNYLSSFVQY